MPKATKIPNTMEVLDDEHVLVDYSNSFSIPDFSKILTVSVLDMDGIYRGSATKDYDKINDDKKKVYPKLERNTKIKAKLNPCEKHQFSVRITFEELPTFVNSLHNDYIPGAMENFR